MIESRDRSQDLDDPEDRESLQNSDPVRVSHLVRHLYPLLSQREI